ncbi:MAG TPA: hypothetical protein VMJ10_06910 [Kofleriaceae bacterium]|nr:hypothetical protein [Kofleriaceae bacterium]
MKSLLLACLVAACVVEPVGPQPQPPPQPQPVMAPGPVGGPIVVRSASYGPNCGVPRGNVTDRVAQLCNGKPRCAFHADNSVFADPAFGCPKQFVAEWTCGEDRVLRRTPAQPPRGGEGYAIELSCY